MLEGCPKRESNSQVKGHRNTFMLRSAKSMQNAIAQLLLFDWDHGASQ